jgi:hypothetical protein
MQEGTLVKVTGQGHRSNKRLRLIRRLYSPSLTLLQLQQSPCLIMVITEPQDTDSFWGEVLRDIRSQEGRQKQGY